MIAAAPIAASDDDPRPPPAGGAGGYLVAQYMASGDAARATRDAYRRGLQDGHNRLAHRHGRKIRKASEVAPRLSRATLRDGL